MEARIVKPEERGPRAEYPCLKKHQNAGDLVVLFTGPTTGTVVSLGSCIEQYMGYFSDDWEEDYFNPLPYGTEVVLKN